jgi:hypothetical protein
MRDPSAHVQPVSALASRRLAVTDPAPTIQHEGSSGLSFVRGTQGPQVHRAFSEDAFARTTHPAHKSPEGREHLRVRREPAGHLLGVREPAIHRNLEHAATGPVQFHLRARCGLLNQSCRHTGARFIASHSAIFDLNLHKLPPGCRYAYVRQKPPRSSGRNQLSRKPSSLHHDALSVCQSIPR